MAKTIVGLFDNVVDAQEAIQDLINQGTQRENISLLINDVEGRYARELGVDVKTNAEIDAAAKGAGIGGALGGIGGLLLGIGAFTVAGIGPILGAGPLIAALGGAGVGAVTGGMIGALTEAGVPEQDANVFAEGVRRGGTLVIVYSDDAHADQAAEILNRHRPVDVEERASQYRSEKWNGFNESVEPFAFDRSPNEPHEREGISRLDYGPGARSYISGQPVQDYDREQTELGNYQDRTTGWHLYESRFREDFARRYGESRANYVDYRDAYRYGFDMAQEGRYANATWEAVRPELRRGWHEQYGGTIDWDEIEELVHHAWEVGRTPR